MTPIAGASGVGGVGTPESCDEAALDRALAAGGTITVYCGPDAVTIVVTDPAGRQPIDGTVIDGGGLVTISAGNLAGCS